VSKNIIAQCKYPFDIRGQLHNVDFTQNESDRPVLLPYLMVDCLISGNRFSKLTIAKVGVLNKGDFKNCNISSNHLEALVISGGNLDCQPHNISITDNVLYQSNEVEGKGIYITANQLINKIGHLSINSNKISSFYYGLHINVKSAYLENNEFNNCYQNEVVTGDKLLTL